jgi:hypothetical protein
VKSPAQIGPDLSIAVEDVQSRFGRTLDDFMREADRDDVRSCCRARSCSAPRRRRSPIQKLREAFAEHQKQKAGRREVIDAEVRPDPARVRLTATERRPRRASQGEGGER